MTRDIIIITIITIIIMCETLCLPLKEIICSTYRLGLSRKVGYLEETLHEHEEDYTVGSVTIFAFHLGLSTLLHK